jgi:cyclopropane fatty-acyl-phospholipid synthase-like methyltransferase
MYTEISKCRICQGKHLISVLSLGEQVLTGIFPKHPSDIVSSGPLELVWCASCGLLQLKQSYSVDEMYGNNYGYRSGLNASMASHLKNKVKMLENFLNLSKKDLVLDIGSNDGTLLKAYKGNHEKVGIDPTGIKFSEFYTDDIDLIPTFFSKEVFTQRYSNKKAKIITSIAMFYDLENPTTFVKDIESILSDDGIWHFEQSYMPSMLRSTSYDTICHEHLEFYSFKVIKDLLEFCGLRIIDVQLNAINGGSFAVTACKKNAQFRSNHPVIEWMVRQEDDLRLDTPKPYRNFEERVFQHRKNLLGLIDALISDGKKIFGYGASTKGNVLLQFCGITSQHIPYIAEVNKDKFGCYTPGTHIPIISEEEARSMKPDYFLVFPWHFKHYILEREREYIENGGKFIFPLPEIEIV